MSDRKGPLAAAAGTVVELPAWGAQLVVQPKCDVSTFGGYWVCVAHGPCRNNLEMEGHTQPGCAVAWYCFGHNQLEVP